MAIKGVLFDKDGTLLEFHPIWLKVSQGVVTDLLARYPGRSRVSAQSLLAAVGVHGDRVDHQGLLASSPVEDTALAWFNLLTPDRSVDMFIDEVKMDFNQNVKRNSAHIHPLPGVEATLIKLKQQGFKLGIATADTKVATLYSLKRAGLLALFDFIGYSDGDIAPKPDPALLEAFCRQCGLMAGEVVMLGDTVSDMKFGQNAGATSIGVLTGTATQAELAPYASLVLASVADLDSGILRLAQAGA